MRAGVYYSRLGWDQPDMNSTRLQDKYLIELHAKGARCTYDLSESIVCLASN